MELLNDLADAGRGLEARKEVGILVSTREPDYASYPEKTLGSRFEPGRTNEGTGGKGALVVPKVEYNHVDKLWRKDGYPVLKGIHNAVTKI